MPQFIDPPKRRISPHDLASLANRVCEGLWDHDAEILNNDLFALMSHYPIVEVPIKVVDRGYSDQLPTTMVWAYQYKFDYTHMDEEGDYWIEEGADIKTGYQYNLDDSIRHELIPDFIRSFEAAESIRSRMLRSSLLRLSEVERRSENGFEVLGWDAVICLPNGTMIGQARTDLAARAIVGAVLNAMIDNPSEIYGVEVQ